MGRPTYYEKGLRTLRKRRCGPIFNTAVLDGRVVIRYPDASVYTPTLETFVRMYTAMPHMLEAVGREGFNLVVHRR